MPDPRSDGAIERVADEVVALCSISQGRALVLTTSHRALGELAERVRPRLPTAAREGEAPRERLLEDFRADVTSVLIATSTFWSGIDVQGEALSLLVIEKLPFSAPGDPLYEARCERVDANGGDWFREYALPSAVLQLRQGFGRLIRGHGDRGVVAILDPRLRTRAYGRAFLASLRACPADVDDRGAVAGVLRRPGGRIRLNGRPRGEPEEADDTTASSPRKIQAPKQRHAPRQGLGADRTRMILYAVAAAGAIAVAIVLIVLVAGGKSSSAKVASGASDPKVKQAMLAAGCTFVSKPVLPPLHGNFHNDAPTDTTKVKWSTFPPSGGGHYAAWAIWNFYTDNAAARPEPSATSSGAGSASGGDRRFRTRRSASCADFYNESPTGMLGTPLAGLGDKGALSAWVGDPSALLQGRLLQESASFCGSARPSVRRRSPRSGTHTVATGPKASRSRQTSRAQVPAPAATARTNAGGGTRTLQRPRGDTWF